MTIQGRSRIRRSWGELVSIVRRAGDLWRLTPARPKLTLAGGICLMVLGGAANTAIPLLLGKLVDSVKTPSGQGQGPALPEGAAGTLHGLAFYLSLLGLIYLVREFLQVGRRFLVEYTCTHLEKHLFVRLLSHLLMADLTALSKEKIGTLHGRILRNIAGSVRFFRVGFLDFLPALLAGGFALIAVFVKAPWVGLVMLVSVPISMKVTRAVSWSPS